MEEKDKLARYPVWLTDAEVRRIIDVRDTYNVLDSVVRKIAAGAAPKGSKDPINRLLMQYKRAEEINQRKRAAGSDTPAQE